LKRSVNESKQARQSIKEKSSEGKNMALEDT
jgi:hypothetical protein